VPSFTEKMDFPFGGLGKWGLGANDRITEESGSDPITEESASDPITICYAGESDPITQIQRFIDKRFSQVIGSLSGMHGFSSDRITG